ncbi:potassium/sodium hyperpolarization-activated cyclic nucleotide-gated channel 2-like, partial [Diorhabda sublineata]|uniref:potassium/sodium hyperpolarization-activated cyclic nucleotide-gated channel 2-like n=1 Tax=Diorhabda sublineata TaxID=1163346 RepID=UPI0024E1269E
MPHSCNLISRDEVTEKIEDVKKKSKLTKWWLEYILISEDHPRINLYFKSKKAIHMEKLRHIRSGYTYVIHPISKFRFIYKIYMIFLVGINVIRKYHFQSPPSHNNSKDFNLYEVYFDYIFRSSAYIFGITVPNEYLNKMTRTEDYLITIFIYILGKILIISTWLIIALSILSTKSTHIKFQHILKEVEEFMIRKKLPPNLRTSIINYYNFKYQGSFLKEDLIQFILPDNLRKDINLGICKYLINNVSIFGHLKYEEVIEIVEVLIPEIFLPNDCIIQSGTIGESMYFIASGTVAVYTHSGEEICHLQDGDYFGEISLLMKNQDRPADIYAIETSHIYKLNKT